jgi:hypothetical protein
MELFQHTLQSRDDQVVLKHQQNREQNLMKRLERFVQILRHDIDIVLRRKQQLEGQFGS